MKSQWRQRFPDDTERREGRTRFAWNSLRRVHRNAPVLFRLHHSRMEAMLTPCPSPRVFSGFSMFLGTARLLASTGITGCSIKQSGTSRDKQVPTIPSDREGRVLGAGTGLILLVQPLGTAVQNSAYLVVEIAHRSLGKMETVATVESGVLNPGASFVTADRRCEESPTRALTRSCSSKKANTTVRV